jgi:hypothetical protein
MLTVSSMHRAKGLEYDRVYILEHQRHAESDPVEEARLLYVAMTRSRDDVFRLDPLPQTSGYTKRCTFSQRWARYQFRRPGLRLGLELESRDVSAEFPPGSTVFTEDVHGLQKYLATSVRPGDPVTLLRVQGPPGDDLAVPDYTIEHHGRSIGIMSQRFRRALALYICGRRPANERRIWPSPITNCWIDDIEAVTGSQAAGRREHLGDHGVWLAPRLTGLTWFRYTSEGGDST